MNIISKDDSVVKFLENGNWFDPTYYGNRYKDVGAYPLGLACHFINHGVTEGRVPKEASLIPTLRRAYTEFVKVGVPLPSREDSNVQFFHWMIANEQVLSSLDTVFNTAGGRDDNLLRAFAETRYAQESRNKLVAIHTRLQGLSAFIALITVYTQQEQAQSALDEILDAISQAAERNYLLARDSGEFDEKFYLTTYADVRNAGVDPLRHYLQHGYLEGRDPSGKFSTVFYLSNNHDVKASGQHPFLHYIIFGKKEGRTGRPARIVLPNRTETRGNRHSAQLVGALYEIANGLSRYDAVSFDFFDTLVERRVPDPHIVFSSMQQHDFIRARTDAFRTLRVQAENIARSKGKIEITISDIYHELSRISSFSEDDIEHLISLEQEYELATLSARHLGIELLAQARARGMKIVIASDFYIGEHFLRRVMEKSGISAEQLLIIVSCDHQCTKHDGSMFELIKEKLGLPATSILHIGDNEHSDYRMPLARGFSAACLPPTKKAALARNAIEFYAQPPDASENINIYSSLALDRHINEVVAAPEVEAAEFGYKILGPVVLAYCQFLKHLATSQNADNLLFLSRDTRVIYDAFATLQGNDDVRLGCEYVLVSRQAVFGASVKDVNAIHDVVNRDYAKLSFLDMLRERFLFDDPDIESLLLDHPWLPETEYFDVKGPPSLTKEKFTKIAIDIFDAIKSVSGRRHKAYRTYLSQVLGSTKNSLLVDIGYRGTTQVAFSRLFGLSMNAGYFMTWPEIDKVSECGLGAWALAPAGSKLQHDMTKFVSMLELVFSDPNTPTLRCFAERGGVSNPVFGSNDLSVEQAAYLTEAHRHAISFCKDTWTSMELLSLTAAERYDVCAPLLRFFNNPPHHFTLTFRNAVFEDKFGGASHQLMA